MYLPHILQIEYNRILIFKNNLFFGDPIACPDVLYWKAQAKKKEPVKILILLKKWKE